MTKYQIANVIFSKFTRNYAELKRDLPIRPSEMAVLNIITQRVGRYTPLMIAELLGVSKPMVAAHIAVLEEKGYITKEQSDTDKRSFYILPTDKAKTLVSETEAKLNEHLKRMEETLGEERFEQLLALLDEAKSVIVTKEI